MFLKDFKKSMLVSITMLMLSSNFSILNAEWKMTDLLPVENKKTKVVGNFTKDKNEVTLDFESKIKREKINTNQSFLVNKYINDKNCDKTMYNDGFFTTCYNYYLKGAVYGYSKLKGSNVNRENIEKRDKFYQDLNLDVNFRTSPKDYAKSGFDMGHSIVNDASFDYSEKSKHSTYIMSNIVPQYPNTNRKSYLSVENYERLIAVKLGNVETITMNFYGNKPQRIGKSGVAVPTGFAKIFWNNENNFQRCFYIPNDDVVYSLKDLEVSCKDLVR